MQKFGRAWLYCLYCLVSEEETLLYIIPSLMFSIIASIGHHHPAASVLNVNLHNYNVLTSIYQTPRRCRQRNFLCLYIIFSFCTIKNKTIRKDMCKFHGAWTTPKLGATCQFRMVLNGFQAYCFSLWIFWSRQKESTGPFKTKIDSFRREV